MPEPLQRRRAADVEIEVIKANIQHILDMLEGDGLPACKIEGMRIEQMQSNINRVSNEVFGNGKPGIKTAVERLEVQMKSVMTIGVMILGAVVTNIVLQWFK